MWRRRYYNYMKNAQPSDAFLSRLELEMNRALKRKPHRQRTRFVAVAAAAAVVVAVTGLCLLRIDRPDRVSQPPVLKNGPGESSGATAQPTPSPAPTPSPTEVSESLALIGLQMLDESAPAAPANSDVNPWYGCNLLTDETVTVRADSSPDSEVIATLQPGDSYWYVDPSAEGNVPRLIRWWNREPYAMETGWAEAPVKTDAESPLHQYMCPGKVRSEGVTLRYGPSFNAPEISKLEEGQYLTLYYAYGNWIFASTAFYDQTGDNPPPPTAGWVSVGRVWGLASPTDDADEQLPLQASGEGAWPSTGAIFSPDPASMLWDIYLVGSQNSFPLEVKPDTCLYSENIAVLYPGDAYWRDDRYKSTNIVDSEGNALNGYAVPIRWLDESTGEFRTGWSMSGTTTESSPGEADNPLEILKLPGKVCTDGAALRYARSKDAPAVTALNKDQKLLLYARYGNWIYATEELFVAYDDIHSGWIHVSEVQSMEWRAPLDKVDLLAERVNLRDKPDGNVIATVTQADTEVGQVRYLGATLPGKDGDWHYVRYSSVFDGNEGQYGYISADLTHLNTFTLADELPMDGVVSATLRYASGDFSSEQTLTGESLTPWLERLGGALSAYIDTPVCAPGVATVTLAYADGREAVIELSGDSCLQARYGDVTYDLKTPEERAERFLNDGGVDASDVLPRYFDQIRFPWDA